jgi:hypothetical protein
VLDKWWSTNAPFFFAIYKGWDNWNYGERKYFRLETRHLYDGNGELKEKVATPVVQVNQEEDEDEEGEN